MKKQIWFLLPILILVSCQSGPEPLVASKADLIPSVYPISSAIEPGSTETGLYRTVTPFEHANVGRGQIACIELVGGERLETRWVVDQTTMNHTSLVGPSDARVFVSTDAPNLLAARAAARAAGRQTAGYEEQVVWRSAASGEELARSDFMPPKLIGDPLAPGFFGVWYYLGAAGDVYELKVE